MREIERVIYQLYCYLGIYTYAQCVCLAQSRPLDACALDDEPRSEQPQRQVSAVHRRITRVGGGKSSLTIITRGLSALPAFRAQQPAG